jgi:hypothetical protein
LHKTASSDTIHQFFSTTSFSQSRRIHHTRNARRSCHPPQPKQRMTNERWLTTVDNK